jgi:hypothetical protein
MSIQLIKEAIKTNLDALVTDSVLGGATITDIRKDPLAADIPSFPHAFLMPPAVESEVLDNRSVLRTYTFSIMILFNAENLTSTTELEETVESILSKFDNNPTLDGTANGGVLPVSSSPQPFQHNSKDLIVVSIELQAKEPVSLSFS